MNSHRVHIYFILVLIFGTIPVFANDQIFYLIKSLQWGKIEKLNETNHQSEEVLFAQARYFEDGHRVDPEKKILKLASILLGKNKGQLDSGVIQEILDLNFSGTSVIQKLSFWKLYTSLSQKNLLTPTNKIQYLKKFPKEEDPIAILVFEEIIRTLYRDGKYQALHTAINSLSEKEKNYLLSNESNIFSAKSYLQEGEAEKGIPLLLELVKNPKTPSHLKKMIFVDLEYFLGKNYYKKLQLGEAIYFTEFLKKDESLSFLQHFSGFFTHQFEKARQAELALRLVNITDDSRLMDFWKNQSSVLKESEYLTQQLIRILLKKNKKEKHSEALSILKNFKSGESLRLQMLLQKSLGRFENSFYTTLDYLKVNPYDLTAQDSVIDYLLNRKKNTIYYNEKKYFKSAMESIPNLPVKGRFIYWYLRFLKDREYNSELKELLGHFYEYCPGSYYIKTIQDEFRTELGNMTPPSSPFSSRDNMIRYLSIKGIHDEQILNASESSFAFLVSSDAFDLGVRIQSSASHIRGDKQLDLASRYLQLGEEAKAFQIVDFYAEKNNLNGQKKFEILAAMGDITYQPYHSLFNTRRLMKLQKIPDDPLFLPPSVVYRLYPRPHRETVKKYSEKFKLSEDIIYGIMRQESFFREKALSSSRAMGLMQVIPSTGKFLAKYYGIKEYSLFDPEISIAFGAKFLADLMKSYSNELKWTAIAYNGGPGNLRKWKRKFYSGDFHHFLEDLPVKESRDYCRITLSNFYNYFTIRRIYRQ